MRTDRNRSSGERDTAGHGVSATKLGTIVPKSSYKNFKEISINNIGCQLIFYLYWAAEHVREAAPALRWNQTGPIYLAGADRTAGSIA